MGKVVTYKSNGRSGIFSQIKLDSKERVLISIAQPGLRIYKQKFFGIIPGEVIFDEGWDKIAAILTGNCPEFVNNTSKDPQVALKIPLDFFVETLVKCSSVSEVKEKLRILKSR